MLTHFRLDFMPCAGRAHKRTGRSPLMNLHDSNEPAVLLRNSPFFGSLTVVRSCSLKRFFSGEHHETLDCFPKERALREVVIVSVDLQGDVSFSIMNYAFLN